MPQTVDTLIHARWIIPVVPQNTVLEQHALAIHHGRIKAILPSEQAKTQFDAKSVIELVDHALIPGLINAHTHAAMNLFKGLADDLPLMDWLNKHIWPAEQKWVGEEFVADGTRLAIAEMIRGGTTCFNDMYFFPDITAQVSAAAGMRASIGMIVIDFPSSWAEDTNAYFNKGLALHDEYRDHPLISTSLAPHAPYSVSDEPLNRVQMLSNELDIPVHMHVHETRDEISMGVEKYGKRPIARLNELNMLSPALNAVHMTQLEDDEITLIAENGVSVVHCPQSNLKLASGFCPVNKLAKAGINIALGTDSSASNNNLDMFEEMQLAAMLSKAVADDASAIPAQQVLEMATINGARALGIEQETGSLEIGKAADIAAIDLSTVNTQPVYNPVSQIVYAAHSEQVTDVWIAGKRVLKQGQLSTLDPVQLIEKAGYWKERISKSDA
jgi:5-methylthioadenosine/S-adenosylhomocysteine deaminase